MAFFAKTVQRKLLGILLFAVFAPAVIALVYNYSVFSLGFENVLGAFLQDRAELVAGRIDESLQKYLLEFGTVRAAVADGRSLADIKEAQLGKFQQLAISDRQGAISQGSNLTSATRIELLPGVTREIGSSQVFFNETVSESGETNLIFQTALDANRFLTAIANSSDVLRASGETIGSSFLRIYSNRGVFPGQGDDQTLRSAISQGEQHIREQLVGWLSTGQKNPGGGSLVGFAESKLLRMRRNEGLTTVEWITLARMDVQEVTSLLTYMMWKNLLFALALAPILGLVSYLLARRFLAPVRSIHQQAERIGQGYLDARSNVHTGDELQQLAEAFNDMATKLRSSRDSVERYIQSLEKKARQISITSNISRSLTGPFDLEQLCEVTQNELGSLLNFDALTLVVFGDSEAEGRRFSSDSDVFDGLAESDIQSMCEDLFKHFDNHHQQNSVRLQSLPLESTEELHFDHYCIIPLREEGGLSGVLALGRNGAEEFSADECQTLEQIGGVLAVAIEHIGLYDRTRKFATELEEKVEERAGELQRAQEQLFRIERFAATGRLAGNIAHEINNPLGVIKNYLRLFQQKQIGMDAASSEALEIVQQELERIARIVRSLLDFYRPGPVNPQKLNVSEEIRYLMPLMEAGFRRRSIRVALDLDDSLPSIEMPRDHLRQVLLNLLKNAEEAVEDRGKITVRTRLISAQLESHVCLEISDDGCGIQLEDQAQVFEPFFTRKRDGQGTGLGLAVTYSIIQSLNGSIELESRPGEGSTFRVLLPCRYSRDLAMRATSALVARK